MSLTFFIFLTLFLVLLTLASWAVEKTKWIYLVIFFALPIAALGHWLDNPDIAWMSMVKLATILLCAIWLWLIRFTDWFNHKTILYVSYGLLLLNIGEVSLIDLYNGFWLNALAGLFLLIAIPSRQYIAIVKDQEGVKDFTWHIPWLWIASYTLWNWTFIVNLFPQSIFTQAAVLLAPVIIGLFIGREHSIKGRVHSLSLYLMVVFTWLPVFAFLDVSPVFISPTIALVINASSMFLAFFAMLQRFLLQPHVNRPRTSSVPRDHP